MAEKNGLVKWAACGLVMVAYIVAVTVYVSSLSAAVMSNKEAIQVLQVERVELMRLLHKIDKKQALIMQKLGVELPDE